MALTFDLPSLVRAAVQTVRDPREGAREVLSENLDRAARWEILLLVVVIGAILAELTFIITGQKANVVIGPPALTNPLAMGLIQLALLVTMIFGIDIIGRRAGGRGTLDDAILIVAWLQFIMVCLQVVQTALMLVMPPLAVILGFFGLILFFWLLTHFVAEVHGFKSMGSVFLSILLCMVGLAVAISFLLGILGVSLVEG